VLERLGAARGLGDDVDALLLEQVAEPGAEEIVVVDQQYADGVPAVLGRCDVVQLNPPRRGGAECTSGG
jgi:hypothetical protein